MVRPPRHFVKPLGAEGRFLSPLSRDTRLEETKPAINTTGQRRRGGVPDVEITVSDAKIEANRTQNWRTGKYAKHVTQYEADERALSNIDESAPDVMRAFAGHILDGDSSGTDMLAVSGLAATELLRRRAADDIAEHGALIREDLFSKPDREGEREVIGSRFVANPAAKIMLDAAAQLGHTAADRLLTPKSRGEGEKDAAMAAVLRHDLSLRKADKGRLPAPPPAIEAGRL